MDARETAIPQRDEDYNFIATTVDRDGVTRRLVCRIWLPERVGQRLTMLLSPIGTRRYLNEFLKSPIVVKGRFSNWSDTTTRVLARKVWTPRGRRRSLSGARRDILIEAAPIDLLITKRRKGRAPRSVGVQTRYLLTQCPVLAPAEALTLSYTGDVTVEKLHEPVFTLRGGTPITFTNHYKHQSAHDDRLSFPELVASTERKIRRAEFFTIDHEVLQQIDELLALVGFASRYRSACVGAIGANDAGDDLEFYRQDIVVPENDPWQHNQGVVDVGNFEEFLLKAYSAYVATGPNELLTQAFHLVTPSPHRTLESSFTALYAALETVVLWYRQQKNLELIISDDTEWSTLAKDVSDFLTAHDLLVGKQPERKQRRAFIRAKIGELRRVPFRAAFQELCSAYDVRLDDLWPMFSQSPNVSLTEIRNRIVHGRGFRRTHQGPLWSAEQHMRWTTERVLLGVLGWPAEQSSIRPESLKVFTAMTELTKDLSDIRDDVQGPDPVVETS